ncbi:HD domain-containing protein [Ramlibacter monticola]|uniref:HD domain-containing protein n=1 Tax=Ramlibacter monticola TaxID=1926872 RepID=A0A937CTD5_9BURK|nr:HD domain-containing protein [Ramlibacter monticola]MBL0392146.1 HD domain-containing protein [Ramlibacter monticola]
MPLTVDQIIRLYRTEGAVRDGIKNISQEQHALQCAQLAEQAGAGPQLVAAALLHDLGHLLQPAARDEAAFDDLHEFRVQPFLRNVFPRAVLDPILLHVRAKRYLCALSASYWDRLSSASKRSLELQGGPLRTREIELFLREPHAMDAVALRQWDDQARSPTRRTPGWDHYRRVLQRVAVYEPEVLAA